MNNEVIYLRAIEPDDHLTSYKWRNDFDLIRGYSLPRYVSKETERNWVLNVISDHENGKSIRAAICSTVDDKLIGYASLLDIDYHNRSCEFGIIIGDKDFHGKGAAFNARLQLFKYAFLELGLERIWARVLSNNLQAIKQSERFGYVKDGVLRRAAYRNGQFIDVILYSMLRDEFISKYIK